MSIRWSRLATGMLVVAAIVLAAQHSWAIRQGLPPSKDEWGLKYHVEVAEAGDNLNVTFTLNDDGRLKPIYSVDLVAFSKQTDNQGGRSYDVMEPIKLTKTADGKQVGQASFNKQYLDRAKIRLIALHVDGKRQPSGGVFFDIPVAKYWNTTTAAKPR